jgi:predicted acylesterase/phospholipase RssA
VRARTRLHAPPRSRRIGLEDAGEDPRERAVDSVRIGLEPERAALVELDAQASVGDDGGELVAEARGEGRLTLRVPTCKLAQERTERSCPEEGRRIDGRVSGKEPSRSEPRGELVRRRDVVLRPDRYLRVDEVLDEVERRRRRSSSRWLESRTGARHSRKSNGGFVDTVERTTAVSALDAVNRPTGGFPRVVRGARAEARLVADDPWVSPHFLRALCVPEEVRVVALLPDEHEVCGGHEVGDEGAAFGGAGERIRANAEPAAVLPVVVTLPQLLVELEIGVREHRGAGTKFRLHAGTIALVPESTGRDVGVVLSGGGINGVLLELGFLRRLAETALWPRIGWIYGTSAGALAGTMAALDRLDDLEEFLLGLQAEDAFRPRAIWQFPGGLHDYTLPETVATRIGSAAELGAALAASPIELLVYATDVGEYADGDGERDFELEYSSRTTTPETMGRAILASAAISGIVLPLVVDDRIATDGGWVRNFPFEHAYRNPDVAVIAAFRYVASYPASDATFLERTRERLERFRAVPPVRALLAEVRLAEERASRGEPAHYGELIVRLMRVAFARNAVVEERLALERETSVTELQRLREDVIRMALDGAPWWRRKRLRADLAARFEAARFPFRHERHVPALIVRGTSGSDSLDPTFRGDTPWPEERKRALIERGYSLTDEALQNDALGLEAR